MLGNPDIWREILSHLEIDYNSFLAADVNDQKLKRKTILHISLLSSDFVGIGLDALWKSMKTLKPIVNILNGNATVPSEESLQLQHTSGSPLWILRRTIEADRIDIAKRYLSRIQYFHFQLKEGGKLDNTISLGLVLSGILENGAYLLPNLAKLHIRIARNNNYWNHIHPTFTSPALKYIIYDIYRRNLPIIIHHLNLLKLQSPVDLTAITISCCSVSSQADINDLIDGLTCFENLQKLDISLASTIDSPRSFYPPHYLLSRLTNLRFLSIGLDMFAQSKPTSLTNAERFTNVDFLSKLRELRVKGRYCETYEFISNFTTCNTLTILAIDLVYPSEKSLRALVNKASSTFPFTKSLSIRQFSSTAPLTFTDLSGFLTHKHLTSFSLSFVTYSLTSDDIAKIMTHWPNLETFEISCNILSSSFSPDVLINFSTLPYLHRLVLPLDFSNFYTSLFNGMKINRGRAPLRTLTISEVDSPLELLQEKIILVNYLLRLFPSLLWIKMKIGAHPLVTDLQYLISSHRAYHEQESAQS